MADEDILESMLDGALGAEEEKQLRARIDNEPQLKLRLGTLRTQREQRLEVFEAMEGDEEYSARLLASVRRARWNFARWARAGGAVAACLAIFAAGWAAKGRWERPQQAAGAMAAAEYRVAIMDEGGRVLAVQKFDSLEKAREFSEDLRKWQEMQEQLVEGRVVVRSASF